MKFLRKLLWVRADWSEPWESRKRFVRATLDAGADALLVGRGEAQAALKEGTLMIASTEDSPGVGIVVFPVAEPSKIAEVMPKLRAVKSSGRKTAVEIEIKDKASERAAVEASREADFLIISARDWKIIPLENIIANVQKGCKILQVVKSAEEARVAAETLEVGAAGVVLDPRETGPEEIKRTSEILEKLASEKLQLSPARVEEVRAVGSGDRACIDTTVMMEMGEGMLVGSQAEGLFLVHSETLPSEFVEQRPFRVNAGAVHGYVRVPDGKTKYLSELKAGDEVLVVNFKGETRRAVVGRVKIERRPLVLVEAEKDGRRYKIVLQNAETINLVGKDGRPISVARLKPGDEVLILTEAGGRHFGTKVEEMMVER
ncbi:MAG: 3-dehydroquinate synthase II [Candidatus Hadarchaeales archaeon]